MESVVLQEVSPSTEIVLVVVSVTQRLSHSQRRPLCYFLLEICQVAVVAVAVLLFVTLKPLLRLAFFWKLNEDEQVDGVERILRFPVFQNVFWSVSFL